ncbi:RluA family pseudouridine synthase [Syntrophobacter fumaroxidans]|uniref:Ribosomal large subunit pseudouridine synthase D n=1 Tax=Syntrophobacter fumaroxidans (strain DSM 10017 / MPOB) TaxID=335543 RepID=A0LHE4_SYNFM|nr:RluA family pseudouridine synthase [Syntrophobacter fumaroxidans]ABK16846.1 ribosomal large subunit pseudouridine synthase D [Syntrophobacter fumaroxidans MPOB]
MKTECFYHPLWPIIYEDNHLLGLYKPAGLLVQGDRTGEASLLDLGKKWLKECCGKPGKVFLAMVHRLDRPVAGVVLFCRTSKAAARISAQFRSGRIRKHYLAVAEGDVTPSAGRLVNQLERHDERSSVIVAEATPRSREARLSYRVLDVAGSRSLLEIELETGRHHQIRLQLAHLGFPILGDLRYGASAPLPGRQVALFATQLELEHPTRKESLLLRCPLPQSWPWPSTREETGAPPWNWSELEPLLDPGSGTSM